MPKSPRIIISGGGTGGHIFPALAIASEIQKRYPDAHLHFVGASNRMEMQRIPAAGHSITGIPIAGFQRRNMLKNLSLPWKIIKSLWMVRRIIKQHRPDVVVGTGGYVSGPVLWVAQRMGIPTLIQEQNSFAGKTNRLVAKKARAICTAYPNMESVFPAATTYMTGNPVRPTIAAMADQPTDDAMRASAKRDLGFNPDQKLILILGGSLGARAINQAVTACEASWRSAGHQVLWQCGKIYFELLQHKLGVVDGRIITDFLSDMPTVYRAADVIVSRAGAGTLSELCCVGAASLLIPSPNVAEDHQRHNASSLVDRGGARMMLESDIDGLGPGILALLADPEQVAQLRQGAQRLAQPHAAADIVDKLEPFWS